MKTVEYNSHKTIKENQNWLEILVNKEMLHLRDKWKKYIYSLGSVWTNSEQIFKTGNLKKA